MTPPQKTRTIPNIMQHHVIIRPGGMQGVQPVQNSKLLHQVPNLPTGVTKVLLLNNQPRHSRPIANQIRPMPSQETAAPEASNIAQPREHPLHITPKHLKPEELHYQPPSPQQKLSTGMKTLQMKALRFDKSSMKLIPVAPDEEIRMKGVGPGRGKNQAPKEKRLVRKFCLVQKPHDGDSSTTSEPMTITRRIQAAKPHTTHPEPIQCPKFISQVYNRAFMRYERVMLLAEKEIQITESQTQTDPDLTLLSAAANLENMGIHEESSTLKRALLLGPENVTEAKKQRLQENFNALDKVTQNPMANTKLTVLREKPQLLEKARKDFEICQQQDEFGNLPLHIAVINNRTSAIVRQAMVLKAFGKCIDQRNRRGLTPLQLCLMNNCEPEAVRKLVRLEANLKLRDPKENTVLHLAVLHSSSENLAEILPFVDDLVNEFNEDGLAPLHLAVMSEKIEHVSLLVKSANIDINLPDIRSGRTPLFHASERKYLDLARLILYNGGSKQKVNYAGQSVLTMSLESELLKGMDSDSEDTPPVKRRGKARK